MPYFNEVIIPEPRYGTGRTFAPKHVSLTDLLTLGVICPNIIGSDL